VVKKVKTTTTVDEILRELFTNGAGEEADRLLLVKEAHAGAATVTHAEYLGGYSKAAIRRILDAALITREGMD
jgi:hypothetical protein